MEQHSRPTVTVRCACGQVIVEAVGAPIASAVCHCDDCQQGATQIRSLPGAASVEEPGGGTAYLAYRKDRVTCLQGASLLKPYKIRERSATHRMVAGCCNSPMYLGFDDAKHWVDLYRSRCEGDLLPVQMHICTRFKPENRTIPADVPQHARYPVSFLLKLVVARLAMVLHS